MANLRSETRKRARAVQLLYAWEVRDRPALQTVSQLLLQAAKGSIEGALEAERLAMAVTDACDELDGEIESAVEGWRFERLGVVERSILRLGLHELRERSAPPRVVIDEAVRLAHWLGGGKSPGFVNGVLDALARRMGQL